MNQSGSANRSHVAWAQDLAALSRAGLNQMALINPPDLPESLAQQCDLVDPKDNERLLLLGATGGVFWKTILNNDALDCQDPFDTTTVNLLKAIFTGSAVVVDYDIRYPGSGAAPLMALGSWLNWTTPSPLGLGISDDFGLWFAWRACVVVHLKHADALAVAAPRSSSVKACDQCATKPCVSACPAGAVRHESAFDINACISYRTAQDSPCAQSCIARLACPVGGQWQYPAAQFAYHQRKALDGMRRWIVHGQHGVSDDD